MRYPFKSVNTFFPNELPSILLLFLYGIVVVFNKFLLVPRTGAKLKTLAKNSKKTKIKRKIVQL